MSWTETICSKYGRNRFGQPLYRILFAPTASYVAGGYFSDSGNHEYRRIPRYPGSKDFILEKWLDAGFFGSPKSWNEQREQDGFLPIGPYPARGMYVAVMGIKQHALTPAWLNFNLRYQEREFSRGRSKAQIRIQAMDEIEEKNKAREQWLDVQLEDAGVGSRSYLFSSGAAGLDSQAAKREDYIQRLISDASLIHDKTDKFRQIPTELV